MRKQSTANLESVEFAQILISLDRCELEDLIEGRVRPGGLRIVENKAGHHAFAIVSLREPHAAPSRWRKPRASAAGLTFEIGKRSYYCWLAILPRVHIAAARAKGEEELLLKDKEYYGSRQVRDGVKIGVGRQLLAARHHLRLVVDLKARSGALQTNTDRFSARAASVRARSPCLAARQTNSCRHLDGCRLSNCSFTRPYTARFRGTSTSSKSAVCRLQAARARFGNVVAVRGDDKGQACSGGHLSNPIRGRLAAGRSCLDCTATKCS